MKLAVLIAIASAFVAMLLGAYLWARKASRRAAAKGDDSLGTYSITPTGLGLVACLVGTLILFCAALVLSPQSPLAEFLRSDGGFVISTIAAIAGFSIAGAIFTHFGRPPFVGKGGRGV